MKKAKRAGRVIRGLPKWLLPLVVRAYNLGSENMHPSLRRGLLEDFLMSRNVNPDCLWGFIDHAGHDDAGNFICEAYVRKCPDCQKAAEVFAAKLGVRYELSALTYHAPETSELMRMTFFKPGA